MLALKVIFQEQKVPNRFRPIGGRAFEQWCSLSVRDWTGAASCAMPPLSIDIFSSPPAPGTAANRRTPLQQSTGRGRTLLR